MGTTNAGFVYRTRVAPEAAGASVLAFHVARYRHSDEAAWRAAIALGRVLVNGRRADPEQPLAAGDQLEFHRPPWREPDAPESFDVAFEDEHVLVVVKPANLQVLPAGPFSARTLLALVRSSDASRSEAAPAHRLGRGTSGLIAFGKTAQARSSLSRQLRELSLGKTYLAWVSGARLPASFAARQPIARVPHGPLTIHAAAEQRRPVFGDSRMPGALGRNVGSRRQVVDLAERADDLDPPRRIGARLLDTIRAHQDRRDARRLVGLQMLQDFAGDRPEADQEHVHGSALPMPPLQGFMQARPGSP